MLPIEGYQRFNRSFTQHDPPPLGSNISLLVIISLSQNYLIPGFKTSVVVVIWGKPTLEYNQTLVTSHMEIVYLMSSTFLAGLPFVLTPNLNRE